MWWSPDPRLVLFPDEVRVSHSMKQVMRRNTFRYTINTAFDEVIKNCRDARAYTGTWISPDIIEAYTALYQQGHAISVEAWHDAKLAGGLYGVLIGKALFGESMFSKEANASKAALIFWCGECMKRGIRIIDCQMETNHLLSMGARLIRRKDFVEIIASAIHPER
jgi:leucyl/phenylalanyl-tRNA--protein transferase